MPVCVSCGLFVNGSGLLEVQLRPSGGIACDPDGADAGLYLDLTTAAGSCITITGEGTAASPLTTNVDVSEDVCNGIECRGNGLYAPCPDSIVGADNANSAQATGFPATGPNNAYNWESALTTITNTTCCVVAGRISIQAGGLEATADAGSHAHAQLQRSINGAAYGFSTPDSKKVVHNNGTGVQNVDFNNLNENNLLVLNPAEVVTYRGNLRLFVITGTFNVTGTVNFEIQWDLTQTGCC